MSVYDSNAFHERVNHAYRCILSGSTDSRRFDTCFEMYDGAAVAVALMRRAEKNHAFSQALERVMQISRNPVWKQNWEEYGQRKNLSALSRELIRERQGKL